jgi:hypothetical protein
MSPESDPDRLLKGVEEIGVVAAEVHPHFLKEDGKTVDERKVYYGLEKGYLAGSKYGRLWISTPRKIRASLGVG